MGVEQVEGSLKMRKRRRNGGDGSGQGRMDLAVRVTGEEGQTDADATLCTLGR